MLGAILPPWWFLRSLYHFKRLDCTRATQKSSDWEGLLWHETDLKKCEKKILCIGPPYLVKDTTKIRLGRSSLMRCAIIRFHWFVWNKWLSINHPDGCGCKTQKWRMAWLGRKGREVWFVEPHFPLLSHVFLESQAFIECALWLIDEKIIQPRGRKWSSWYYNIYTTLSDIPFPFPFPRGNLIICYYHVVEWGKQHANSSIPRSRRSQ